ncbi:MAG: hypothetical protein EAZ55_05985 [Cytophagales bacterium]|nr:MAG: hypothetical protein EAZ55_05985 [Cytophagales bacterium]
MQNFTIQEEKLRNELLGNRYIPATENTLPTIAVYYCNANTLFLKEEDELFLTKILKAVNTKLSQIKLINTNKMPVIVIDAKIKKHIFLGITPSEIPIEGLQYYQIKQNVLCADTLQTIAQDTTLKKEFWNALKQLFEL